MPNFLFLSFPVTFSFANHNISFKQFPYINMFYGQLIKTKYPYYFYINS